MAQLDLVEILMLLVGTGLFMVVGFAVCVALMIFCDIINLSGAFEKPADAVLAVVFAPFFLAAGVFDQFALIFKSQEIQKSLRPAILSKDSRTITV